jgi:uncharacterized protein YgbK (DUF1537 family)
VDASFKYAWYGDDFTGASDTLATVAQAGLRTMLFCGVPTDEQFRRAGTLDAVGIAGAARSMAPGAMRVELAQVGAFLAASGARVIHYKCCSTFDSAPHVGSIGVAIDALRGLAPANPVLIVGGQPNLGRHCVFGELYAVAQPDGPVYRIDRHPTMSRHPVTPMQEADLRVHLARQGVADIGLVDIRAHQRAGGLHAALDDFEVGGDDASSQRVVLLDVLDNGQLETIGGAIRSRAQRAPLLAVGASSVAQALIEHARLPRDGRDGSVPAAKGPVLVLAGSLSPVTAHQIGRATSYERVPLDAGRLAGEAGYLREQADGLIERLRAGRHVLAHTSPTEHGRSSQPGDLSARIAPASAALLAAVLHEVRLARVGIAGGDTSSHAVKALGAWGLEWIGRVDGGVPLLRAHADDAHVDGLELMLKGGQMGGDDLFDRLVNGTAGAPSRAS